MNALKDVKNVAQLYAIATTAAAGIPSGLVGAETTMDDGLLRGARPCDHAELCALEHSYVCPACDTVTIRTTLSAARHELAALVEGDHASTTALHRALAYLCP